MRRHFLFSLLIFHGFLFAGCQGQPSDDHASSLNDTALKVESAGPDEALDYLKKFETPSQHFSIPANTKTAVITGRAGTRILVNAADLQTEDGKPLTSVISVELKELMRTSDLLRTNAATVSDGKLLESGGAYFIALKTAGTELALKPGKKLQVEFPRSRQPGMQLFYGHRDETGQMNWTPSSERMVSKPAPPDEDINTQGAMSGLDAIIAYADSGYVETPEDREARKQAETTQKCYKAIGLDKLGWINCDRFLEDRNLMDVQLRFAARSNGHAIHCMLVFQDIMSVMSAEAYTSKQAAIVPSFKQVPAGRRARLLAFSVKDGKVRGFARDIQLKPDMIVDVSLREMTERDFAALL